MSDSAKTDFQVRRDDLSTIRWTEPETQAEQPLEAGEVLLRIDRYAFTANNITYGLTGDMLQYWSFFPAADGWGRLPVWGFADVVASRVPELSEGERVFGYLPMSAHLKVRPVDVTAGTWKDASPHRAALPGSYQNYWRVPRTEPLQEDLRALLQPLFGTGFLIDDFLHEHELYGARQIVIASASSKTALGAAYNLARRSKRHFQLIGLTSERNRAFCERVRFYDRVLDYGAVGKLDASTPTVLVDMSGDPDVLQAVHGHFGGALRYSCLVGMTHNKGLAFPELPGPKPELFFAPAQVQKRAKDWGLQNMRERIDAAQEGFISQSRNWFEVVRARGKAAIESTYRVILEGRAEPSRGVIMSLSGGA